MWATKHNNQVQKYQTGVGYLSNTITKGAKWENKCKNKVIIYIQVLSTNYGSTRDWLTVTM